MYYVCMRLNFLKRNKTKPKTTFNKYNSIARQRRLNILSEKVKGNKFLRIKIPKRIILIPVGVLIIIIVYGLLTSTTFKVQNITVEGYKDKESSILEDLDSLKGRSIFLINDSQIESDIKSKYENIDSVFVYKKMPDGLTVEVVQSQPAIVFSTFTDTFLVKRNGDQLGSLKSSPTLKLLDYKVKILEGEKDLNAQYLEDAFLADLSEKERKDFNWKKVKTEDREAKYNELRDKVFAEVSQYKGSVKKYLKKTVYNKLPLIFSYIPYDGNNVLFNVALEVIDGLKFRSITTIDNTFTTKYTLEERTSKNKLILFSKERSINEQFKDLDSIIFYGRFEISKIIDLRTERYSITY